MNILLFFLVGIYLISCFALIAVILLQSGKGGGLSSLAGGGGGGIGDAIGATSAEKFMNRVTTSIAVGFFLLAIAISIISSRRIDDTPESVFAGVSDAVDAPADGASLGAGQPVALPQQSGPQPISVGTEPIAGPPVASDPGLPTAIRQSAPVESAPEPEPVSSGPARLIEPLAEPAEPATEAPTESEPAGGSVDLPAGFGEPAAEPEMPAEEPAAEPAQPAQPAAPAQPVAPAQPEPAPPAEEPAPENGDSLLNAILGVNPDSDL